MFKQSLRPLARARPASTARLARSPLQVRYNSSRPNTKGGSWSDNSGSSSSSASTTGNSRSAGNWVIPGSMVVVAVAIGAYFYVPMTNDIQQGHKAKSKGGPDIGAKLLDGVKALEPERDVRKSVLDQDSLHVPIHSKAVKESVKEKSPEKTDVVPETVEKKAEEAKQPSQSAFNEETGEINWDCPCLGGMADGPCGEQFKAAFSCFVYSDKEPKGVECVDKFKHMQDCFREHPDIYGEEIDDDDDEPLDGPPSVKSQPDSHQTPPELPKKEPPQNSEILATTPETTPSKGVSKLVPTEKRGDKAPGGVSPPVGEGTVPKPYTGKDKP